MAFVGCIMNIIDHIEVKMEKQSDNTKSQAGALYIGRFLRR